MMQPRGMMETSLEGAHSGDAGAWPRLVLRELRLSWRFTGGDSSSAVVPAMLFLGAACAHARLPVGELLGTLGRGALYFWLFAYVFCLSNQLVGLEEDRLNKPHRPLVSGEASVRGTRWRLVVCAGLFALVGWGFGVWRWALLWLLITVLHNEGGGARRWWAKNLSIAVGVVAQLAAAWELAAPLTLAVWRWIGVLACVVFCLVSLQDLRDVEGDRASGRKTFPLVFGETRTRYVLAGLFGLLPWVIHRVLMVPLGLTPAVVAFDAGLALLSWVIAARVVGWRTPAADHRTYLLFTYWYCLALLSTFILL
ncbi:UbiA family prenyltransferase [Archangium violaceum]|uniref:UbiA family prenyltransferase n=1 Tax=Archangium violaceum TaxID=83451 RepID=UPI00193C09DF|nr:UbiA family prenyltransferase [Archangium violaceum]QRK11236.1 UbiA family prenyltransferase [Archangium violaceum]